MPRLSTISGMNGTVYTNVPLMPNTVLPLIGANFPTSAPANFRNVAMAVCDMESFITLTHNSATAALGFTLYTWSDVTNYWIIGPASGTIVRFGQFSWPVTSNTPIYLVASAGLTGSEKVFLGGVTLQGIAPVPFAGD